MEVKNVLLLPARIPLVHKMFCPFDLSPVSTTCAQNVLLAGTIDGVPLHVHYIVYTKIQMGHRDQGHLFVVVRL